MKKNEFKLLALPSIENANQVINKFPFPIKLTKGRLRNLKFVFKNGNASIKHKNTDLRDFSFVWLSSTWASRDLAYAIKLYLKQTDTPFTYVEKSTSKITDQMLFTLNKIQTPNTIFVSRKEIEKNLKLIEEICNYPLIVKDTKGSRGQHSILISNQQELIEEMKKLPKHKKYLFQEFIPNEYDWGILVANGKVVSGEKSYPCKGEFRNNTCNGAREIFVNLNNIPKKIKDMALKTSKALGLAWSRSDIIVNKNTSIPYLMEINRRPGITSQSDEVRGAYTFLSSQINQLEKVKRLPVS